MSCENGEQLCCCECHIITEIDCSWLGMRDSNLGGVLRETARQLDIDYNNVIIISMIETEQKLIQIGSSEGITLSKKDIAKLGA